MQHLHDLILQTREGLARNVLVVGDVMLDHYIFGHSSRVSPEAPVLIVEKKENKFVLGGAANVAGNLAGLGITCTICGLIGDDPSGRRLTQALDEKNVINGLLKTSQKRTAVKSRILSSGQQIVRVDDEDVALISPELEAMFLKSILEKINKKPSVIVLSDYNKGSLTENICQAVIEYAAQLDVPVIVDPKGVNYEKYNRAHTIKPNLSELNQILQHKYNYIVNQSNIMESTGVIQRLMADLEVKRLVVTLGNQGILDVRCSGEYKLFPVLADSVIDVSGAGDTVTASLAFAYSYSHFEATAIELANFCAGIVIKQLGTATISLRDIDLAFKNSEKSTTLLDGTSLGHYVSYCRKLGKKIVFTNGCFDILHAGHVSYLERAKEMGDILIVAINSDDSVKELKGQSRPINSEEDRAQVLLSLRCVDAVIVFDDQTPERLITQIRPDLLVKGGDYIADEIVGAKFVKQNGGSVLVLPFVDGRSTSETIKRIISLNA